MKMVLSLYCVMMYLADWMILLDVLLSIFHVRITISRDTVKIIDRNLDRCRLLYYKYY